MNVAVFRSKNVSSCPYITLPSLCIWSISITLNIIDTRTSSSMPRSSVTRRATHGLTTSSFTLDMFTRRFSDGGCFGVFDLLFPATRTLRLKGSRIAPAAEEARPAARRAPKNTVLRARGRRKTGLLSEIKSAQPDRFSSNESRAAPHSSRRCLGTARTRLRTRQDGRRRVDVRDVRGGASPPFPSRVLRRCDNYFQRPNPNPRFGSIDPDASFLPPSSLLLRRSGASGSPSRTASKR